MADISRTIIVKASDVVAARQLAAESAESGQGMFITPLSPAGSLPATHFISSGMIDEKFATVLSDASLLHQAATQGAELQGITKVATYEDAVKLVANSIVKDASIESALDTLELLGLKMVNPSLV